MTSWTEDIDLLTTNARFIDKTITLHSNRNWFFTILSWLMFIITIGKKSREDFLKHTAIAIANHHFYPEEWNSKTVSDKITHEGQHTKQCRWFGVGLHPLVGLLPFLIVYYLLPFPIRIAYGRFFLELNAKKEEWIKIYRWTNNKQDIQKDAAHFHTSITSAPYFWAVSENFALNWIQKTVKEVIND